MEKLKNSDVQYYALAYACYKVATPARYTVTVGGTTWSIYYLEKWGMLKTTTQVAEGMREGQLIYIPNCHCTVKQPRKTNANLNSFNSAVHQNTANNKGTYTCYRGSLFETFT